MRSNKADHVKTHKIHTNKNALKNSADTTLQAPDFVLTDLDGEKFRLSDQKGKIVVLNLWATSCGPCVREIPDFIELQKEMADENVLFVGISSSHDKKVDIRSFDKKNIVNYSLLRGKDRTFFKKYGQCQFPELLLSITGERWLT